MINKSKNTMSDVKTNTPDSLKESLPETMKENEAYAKARQINSEDKNHHATVENGELNVNQVLRG